MRIAILAAGYGTRLYPLTQKVAKPLIPINGKPMINFLIDKIERLKDSISVEEIKVVVNSKFYKDFLGWKKTYRIKADIIDDGSTSPDNSLGAIPDMKLALTDNKADWLVLGGDNLFEDDLDEFLEYAVGKKPYSCIGLYDVGSKLEARRFGVVVLNSRGRVVRLEEKPKRPPSTLAASCIYFFPRQSLKFLDIFLEEHDNVDAAGTYISWLARKNKVFGHPLKGKWIDIGHFDSLDLAKKIFVGC